MKHHITSETLANGAALYSIDAPDSSVVEARVYFKAGFEHFTENTYHLPHLLEHLLVGNGGQYNTEEKLLHALQDMGALINASTDYEHVTVHLRAPNKNFLETFSIAIDCIFGMTLTQDALDREKDIVLREIYEQYDGFGPQVGAELLAKAFGGLAPENWEDHVHFTESITLGAVRDAYEKFITPQNMQVVISGNIGAANYKRVRALIAGLHGGSEKPPGVSTIVPQDSSVKALDVDMGDSAALSFVFVSPWTGRETPEQRVAFNFASLLLFDAPSAILPFTLRKKGLVYSVTSEVITLSGWQAFSVSIMTAPDKAHIAAIEIMRYLRLYANGHIPDSEFESVKRYITSMLPTYCETVGDLLGWYGRDIEYGRPLGSVEEEAKHVQNLTAEDVANAVKILFVDAKLYSAVVSADASRWASDLGEAHRVVEEGGSEKEILTQLDSRAAIISEKRASVPDRVGLLWAFYYLLVFVSWVTALNVSQLPLHGSSTDTISPLDYALNYNLIWGICFFAPLTLANIALFARGKYERHGQDVAIVLAFIAAVVYAFGIFRYFGDIGIDNQPWYEDIVSLLQPLFFFVACPLAFVSLARNAFLKSRK